MYEFILPSFNLFKGLNLAGDSRGAKVMLIPGFCAGDQSLYPLAWWLRGAGYRIFFNGIWWNTGCPQAALASLAEALEAIYLIDHQPIVIIGHSLGGIYARHLALSFPRRVARIVLLGSAIKDAAEATNPYVFAFFLASHPIHPDGTSCVEHLRALCDSHPPVMPETIVYSRCDEVVRWTSCLENGPNVECIEVNCSHYLMPYDREVVEIILRRLKPAALDRGGSRAQDRSERTQAAGRMRRLSPVAQADCAMRRHGFKPNPLGRVPEAKRIPDGLARDRRVQDR